MIELNKTSFAKEVLEEEKLVLVSFWGPTCAPCLELKKPIEVFEKEFNANMKFADIDITRARSIAKKHSIFSLPKVDIYKDGKIIDSVLGKDATAENILEIIEKNLAEHRK